jgi:hypothetical protein
MKKDQE